MLVCFLDSPSRSCVDYGHSASYYSMFRGISLVYPYVYVGQRALDHIQHVFIKSPLVQIPFFACIGGVPHCCFCFFCSAFLFFLHSIFHYICPCVWWQCGRGRPKVCRSLERYPPRSPSPVCCFICEYGAYIDSQLLAARQMNGDSGNGWNVWFWHKCNSAVSDWKKMWWDWGGPGTSICP